MSISRRRELESGAVGGPERHWRLMYVDYEGGWRGNVGMQLLMYIRLEQHETLFAPR